MINLKACRSVKSRKIRSGNIISYDLRLDTNEMKLVTRDMLREIESSGESIKKRSEATSIAKDCGILDLHKIESIIVTKPSSKSTRSYTFVIMRPVDTIQTIEVIIN